MPIYVIDRIKDDAANPTLPRLVRARNQAEALRFVARSEYAVHAANAEDVADAMTAGVRLEEVGTEPADASEPHVVTAPIVIHRPQELPQGGDAAGDWPVLFNPAPAAAA